MARLKLKDLPDLKKVKGPLKERKNPDSVVVSSGSISSRSAKPSKGSALSALFRAKK